MSRIRMFNQGGVPATPVAGQSRGYFRTATKRWASIDDTGTVHDYATAADLANLPTDDEKDALVGTDGTPSAANPYVTDSDPRLSIGTNVKIWMDEDFIVGNADADEIGKYGWRTNTSGTGAGISILDGELNRNGLIRLEAGTVAASKADIHLGDTAVGGCPFQFNGTQEQWDFYWDARPEGSILALDLQLFQLGMGREFHLADELLNGIYWRYLPGTDTVYQLVCANGGVRSLAAGNTIAPALNVFRRLGVRITYPAGVLTVQGLVDDVVDGGTITTNIPAGALGPGAKIDSPGGVSTEAMLTLDRCYVQQLL